METLYDSFEEAAQAAKDLARARKLAVSVRRGRSGFWLVDNPLGSPTTWLDERDARENEDAVVNADYYRDQRIAYEGSHEDYARHLNSPDRTTGYED
jgi:hypothetical protein